MMLRNMSVVAMACLGGVEGKGGRGGEGKEEWMEGWKEGRENEKLR